VAQPTSPPTPPPEESITLVRAVAVSFPGAARMFSAVAAVVEASSISAAHAQRNDDNLTLFQSEMVATSNTSISDTTMWNVSVGGPCCTIPCI
jgi:hypothetical protein